MNLKRKGDERMANMYEINDPFSVCFNIMKIKYADLDEYLTRAKFLQPTDKVNIFINMETVFKYLSMINDLEKKLVLQKNFPTILTSNILNLAAHYKRFFINNGLDTRVYLYNTDFKSDEFSQFKYNSDFRSYYLLKYNGNPKFVYLTDVLKDTVIPEVKIICDFIPRVYYLTGKNIEGSLIPYIVGEDDKTRKNIIISGEFYDTQYSLIPNYFVSYMHHAIGYRRVCTNIGECLKEMTKKPSNELESMCNTYSNYSMYCSLISVMGDRMRSIDGLSGVGPKILEKYILQGIAKNEITMTTNNPAMIGSIFHDNEMAEEFINNFYCVSMIAMYDELTTSAKVSVLNQRKDRFDNNSLINLNATKFYNYPLILEALTL
jgi:hypothetical protein